MMENRKFFEVFMMHISAFGTTELFLAVIVVSFLAGQFTLGAQLFLALVFSFIVLLPIKFLFYKERPVKRSHKNWLQKFDAASFPSAHSNRAAILFVILSAFFGKISLSIFLLLLSLLIAYSRIAIKRHFWLDAFAGYLIGIAEAIVILFLI